MSKVIPANWLSVRFEEIFTQISTSGKKVKTTKLLAKGMFPVVDQGRAFISGYLDDSNLVVSDEKPLIIFGDHTREIKWIDFPFIPGADGVKILKPHSEVNGRFLYFFLRNLQIEGKGYARHFKILKDAEYCVPPLAEQTRIAQKLDGLLVQVNNIKNRIDFIPSLLKRFRQSVLTSAVSGRLTEEWRACTDTKSHNRQAPLGELIMEMRNGLSAKPNEDENGLPILRISSVRSGSVDQTDIRFLQCDETEKERYSLKINDLLFTRYNGSLDLVGVCGLIKQISHETIVYPDKLIRVRCKTNIILPKFLELFFSAPSTRQRVMDLVKSTSGQKGISGQDLKGFIISFPCLREQIEIVRRVEQLFAFTDRLEAKFASAKSSIDHLTQSILTKAFRGELVPQDPNDEPASMLLERIAAQRATASKAKRGCKASV